MEEAVILYSHFRNDEISRNHRDLLRKHNPFPVVPLYCDDEMGGTPLEDAVRIPMTYTRGRNWHNIDWLLREWYRSTHRILAERYIWLDWDCYVNTPIKTWYGELWNSDFVGSKSVRLGEQWWWFQQRDGLPHDLFPYASGVVPLNGVLLSLKALSCYASITIPEGIFCELRLATVLSSKGIQVSELPESKAASNIYLPGGASVVVSGNGLFHPVKQLVLGDTRKPDY